jgi:hypothetical protein
MAGDQPVSWLMFFTFAATIFIIAGAFIYFLRSRHNRDIAANALAGGDHPRVNTGTDGALLTVGFKSKPASEQTQNPPLVGQQMQQK